MLGKSQFYKIVLFLVKSNIHKFLICKMILRVFLKLAIVCGGMWPFCVTRLLWYHCITVSLVKSTKCICQKLLQAKDLIYFVAKIISVFEVCGWWFLIVGF